MIGGRKVIAVIPARGGSKGLPGKNVRRAAGRPLLKWTVEAAKAARSVDRVVLSSDDEGIMDVARACGCDVPFRRPDALATDSSAMVDVVLHAMDEVPGYELVLLLQPTSPLRMPEDIEGALHAFAVSGAPACVSVRPATESPFLMFSFDSRLRLTPVVSWEWSSTRRQDLPPAYVLNGAIYIAAVDWLRRSRSFVGPETVAYVMPAGRSLDIDTADDFSAFEKAIQR